jgi:Cyclic nucleotide-binding domain
MNPAELFRRDDDPVRLAPGQTLFREGETGDCMYVLLEGLADVFVGEILVEECNSGRLARRNGADGFKPAYRHGGCNHAGAPGQDR